MHIVHVHIQVKEEHVVEFIAATIENAVNSLKEEGVLRFDVIRQADDPSRFELVEVYQSPEDNAKHRETAHFARWQKTTEKMMTAPRTRTVYTNIFPFDEDWK